LTVRPVVSVVIASVGRPAKLGKSLASYALLDPATPPFEVIVAYEDGDLETRSVVQQLSAFPVQAVAQPLRGIGQGRNYGAECAAGEHIVFLNDDTRVHSRCLLAHLEAQRRFGPCIAVGHVDWDPELPITPYMRWLAPAGHQSHCARLAPDASIGFDSCWGTNLGVPREWVLDERFDDAFPLPALEDGEWGFRQLRRGRPLRFIADARCYHNHHYDGPADYRGRARNAGAAALYTVRQHSGLFWALLLRPGAVACATSLLALWPGRWRRELLWDLDFRWNYVFGMLSGRKAQRTALASRAARR
jgi:GT2 family glycosyltransferase